MTKMFEVGKTQPFPVGLTFGVDAPKQRETEGFVDNMNPYIPARKPYVFRKEQLRVALAFLERPRGDGLYIVGHTGTGKSSLVRQIAARLNWPVQEPPINRSTKFEDLLGTPGLDSNGTKYEHGPAALAVRDGHLLILNEADTMSPGELTGFNPVLDSAPLVIKENGGEVIQPHPRFRLIVTGNSPGSGDETGLYQGVLQQNIAFLDRFRFMEAGYMEEKEEMDLLGKLAPDLPEIFREKMVRVATEIRRLFVGDDKNPGTVTVPFSTRAVQRWAFLTLDNKSAPRVLEYALNQTLLLRAQPEERVAFLRIAKDVFGELWDQGVEAKASKAAKGKSAQAPAAAA